MKTRILIYILLVIFFKCASNSVSDKLNNWKSNQDNNYWYGIAVINKTNQENIQEIARNQAIAEIASQIKIKISQDFTRIVKENNYKIDEYSIQTLDSQVNNNLEEVEIVDFYDLGDKYMLLARLSKQKYYSSVDRKRTNAKELALGYLSKILTVSSENFKYLSKAEKEISPYMDYPIYVDYNNKTENLYSLIQLIRDNNFNRISINTDNQQENIKSLIDNRKLIIVNVIDNETGMPIDKIPLFSNLNGGIDYCFTDSQGYCQFYINQESISKELVQYFYIGIDKSNLYQTEFDGNDFITKITLNLSSIDIFLKVDEYNLDKKVSHSYIEPVIKKFLIKEFNSNFTNDSSNCDLLISITATTRKNNRKPNEYGIYQVFADATVDIRFSDKNESVIKLTINDIQGADFSSFEQAGNKSLQNISDKIFNETLVQLVSILKQN